MADMSNPYPETVPVPRSDAASHPQRIAAARDASEKIRLAARWILQEFDDYYEESRAIPGRAKQAFEDRDAMTSLALSRRRLSIYNESINTVGPILRYAFPQLSEDEAAWAELEARYLPLIQGRYEADFAFAYIHSVRRKVHQGDWKPVDYSFSERFAEHVDDSSGVYRCFLDGLPVSPETVMEMLEIPGFDRPFRNMREDAGLVAELVNRTFAPKGPGRGAGNRIEMVNAGFYRNRGAYLVGRILRDDGSAAPLIIALVNGDSGIYVDAVLHTTADAHNLFSSALANFHITSDHYHELAKFLYSIMPSRPLGLHYTTIGFNHVGKVAVMNELKREIAESGETFDTSVGFRGSVAISFATPSSAYNLKVIRDKPTSNYKWGKYAGIDTVLEKYGRVHEIDRAGSMLDNIFYFNLKLEKQLFDPPLLEELLRDASRCVYLSGDSVIFKHLIAQRKVTPLPVFLETASPQDAETAVINLGYCIKNNTATNIFNRDLDARNYGVGRFHKVFLFDYDALERFTDVKIRTNAGREHGEEDIPEWFFEDGVVFLPEEIEVGLRLPTRDLRRRFREVHGDLLTTEYWEGIQSALHAGKIPRIRTYPDDRKLRRSTLEFLEGGE
jgi:isocitrate dehydrogenase kinase/phosphatase